MLLTDQDIKESQALCRERLVKELSYEKAHEQAVKLLRLMADIYKPMTEDEFDFYIKEREERYRAYLASQGNSN
jgi:hypothetical protein